MRLTYIYGGMVLRGRVIGAGTPRRAIAALLVGVLVVLGLMTVFAVSLTDTQAKSRSDVKARVHERAVLTVALIDSLFHTVAQQLPLDQSRYGGRVITRRSMDGYAQQNEYVALLNAAGRVLASSSGFSAQARADLSSSAALMIVRAGHPYGLGNVLPYGSTGVMNLAVQFPTTYGPRVLLTGFAPSALGPFLTGELSKVPGVKGAHNFLIDGNDTVLASTDPATPIGYRFAAPAQRAALDLPSGDRGGHYYDQVRLSNSTWRVVLAAPDGPLFATVTGARMWLPWLIFFAFALVACVALVLGSRVLHSAEQELRDANERLAHDALHDSLTGLSNRTLFMDRLSQTLQRATRDPSAKCAVLSLDTDRFKLVNDSLSHTVGDQLLIAMAARLSEVVRPGDTVARLGGDEFTLLLENVTTEADATIVAKRVCNALKRHFRLGNHELGVSASIGIAISSPQMDAGDLLRNADIAMYDAKARGSGGYAVFDESMHRRVVDRLARENELRHAVEQSLIVVHYQPIIDLASGRISGLEALSRWHDPIEEVSPIEFIAIAEESGLIGALGLHVLRTSLHALAGWRRAGVIDDDVRLSVNVSRRQLDDPAVPGQILDAIAAEDLPADVVRLEITESTLIHDPDRMRDVVEELRAGGIGLHLDDFGTGYASLAALLQFPIDALKIDRSLITSMIGNGRGDDAIVAATIGLAHGLGLDVIAEGIEDPVELAHLRALGCDYGQGYLFSRPLDPQSTGALLESWEPDRIYVAS